MKRKKKVLYVSAFMLCIVLSISIVSAYGIDEVRYVVPYLETDSAFINIARLLGQWVFELLGSIVTFCEEGFTELMKYDIMQLPILKKIMIRMDTVLYSLLFLGFVVIVFVRTLQLKNAFETLFKVMASMMVIVSFTLLLGMMSNMKDAVMTDIELIVKGESDDTMADTLFKQNTVDILQSMRKGNIVYLSDMYNVDVSKVDTSIRLKRAELNEYYTYDDAGYEMIGKLDDGMFGVGDERYYRYRTDYININITLLLSLIVYILAMFKGGYLMYQWLSVNIFGKLGLAKGFWDLNNIGKTIMQGLKTLGGELILYFSMMLFSVLSSAIMRDPNLANWIMKDILIFAIGMAIVVGSGFVNDFLGIDDGSNFAFKSVFMAHRLGRLGKGIMKAPTSLARGIGNMGAGKGKHVFAGAINEDDDGSTASLGPTDKSSTGNGGVNNVFGSENNQSRQTRFNERFHENGNKYDENGNQIHFSTGTPKDSTEERQKRFNERFQQSFNQEGISAFKKEDGHWKDISPSETTLERNKRFQDLYDGNKHYEKRDKENEDIYKASRNNTETFEEKGKRKGFTGHQKYRPYKENRYDDLVDDEEMQVYEDEMNRRKGG